MASREEEKRRLREERLAAEQREQQAVERRRRLQIIGASVLGVVAVAVVIIIVASSGGGTSKKQQTPGGAPLLVSVSSAVNGRTVNGIQCQTMEQVLYHIHAHLAVYVSGKPRAIPAGIGIPPPRQVSQTTQGPFVTGGQCFYWLHSHTADGIIHIESPSKRTYTLGDYFAIWHQPLSAQQVGPAKGTVTANVNGRKFSGDPASIPLKAHAVIQLDVGTPAVAPQPFSFPSGL
jgi:hypothetical protein